MRRPALILSQSLLLIAVLAHVCLWLSVRGAQARWLNVPPVPSEYGATAFTLGDAQFAYRAIGVMLQNLGDTGGRYTALREYNYDELTRWFFLADRLDPKARYAPFLAAYYFSAVTDPGKFRPLLAYLREVGLRPGEQNWRWLWQAVFIARFNMHDLDTALELANELAALNNPAMPGWTRQMPAFVLGAKGENEAAIAVLVELLKTSADKMDPAEVNSIIHHICDRLLDETAASNHPLCKEMK